MRNRIKWTRAMKAELLEMDSVGASFTEMAARLGITRSAVAGAITRMIGHKKKVLPKAKKEKPAGQVTARARQVGRCFKPLPPAPVVVEVKPEPLPDSSIPVIRAGQNCCRAIVYAEHYCGLPIERGSYCAHHAAKYYVGKARLSDDPPPNP